MCNLFSPLVHLGPAFLGILHGSAWSWGPAHLSSTAALQEQQLMAFQDYGVGAAGLLLKKLGCKSLVYRLSYIRFLLSFS